MRTLVDAPIARAVLPYDIIALTHLSVHVIRGRAVAIAPSTASARSVRSYWRPLVTTPTTIRALEGTLLALRRQPRATALIIIEIDDTRLTAGR